MDDKLEHPNRTQESREAVAEQQRPFAIILGCADSRVGPEILFDQGIGDLFVVRVAGNVAGQLEIDSIDYAALQLGSSVIMVLGHENCGAVTAVVKHQTNGIEAIARLIQPAVKASKQMPGNQIENAIKANVRLVMVQLKKSPVIAELCRQKRLDVVGGYYDLNTGQVHVIR